MLVGLLRDRTPEELPEDVQRFYVLGVPPSRLKWVGATSFCDLLQFKKYAYGVPLYPETITSQLAQTDQVMATLIFWIRVTLSGSF
jgi:hypothetical protein